VNSPVVIILSKVRKLSYDCPKIVCEFGPRSINFLKDSSTLQERAFSTVSLIPLEKLFGSSRKLYDRHIFGQGHPPKLKSSVSGLQTGFTHWGSALSECSLFKVLLPLLLPLSVRSFSPLAIARAGFFTVKVVHP